MMSRVIAATILMSVLPTLTANEHSSEWRWLAFRQHLPEDLKEHLGNYYDNRPEDFEYYDTHTTEKPHIWCDGVRALPEYSDAAKAKRREFWSSFGTGISSKERDKIRKEMFRLFKPAQQEAEAVKEELLRQCLEVAVRYPELAIVQFSK